MLLLALYMYGFWGVRVSADFGITIMAWGAVKLKSLGVEREAGYVSAYAGEVSGCLD